ncbi:MAG TPA: MCP four helix bundle domain-containing protein, partial [Anaerolineales bacterium]|nr:MCP four helix bundle domain-containing protein [Anaerolineales bacterium]HNF37009.1 MCP four helix bundle domain-containing protein [Anaerolineales bacterium]
MNILNNLKTNVKLLGSFMIVAALTAIVGGVGIYYLRLIDAADTRLYHNNTVPLSQLTNIAVAFQRTRVNLRDMLLS